MESINENQACAVLAGLLAERRGFSPVEARHIRIAALLHDIGKQKIPEVLLNKPGPLTAAQFEVMKNHTKLGAEMLSNIPGELGEAVRAVCLYHHEWYNGAGYWGKAAGEVPAYVPVVAIADVFTALISARPYKKPWTRLAALRFIHQQAGTQFSREMTRDFIALINSGGAEAFLQHIYS